MEASRRFLCRGIGLPTPSHRRRLSGKIGWLVVFVSSFGRAAHRQPALLLFVRLLAVKRKKMPRLLGVSIRCPCLLRPLSLVVAGVCVSTGGEGSSSPLPLYFFVSTSHSCCPITPSSLSRLARPLAPSNPPFPLARRLVAALSITDCSIAAPSASACVLATTQRHRQICSCVYKQRETAPVRRRFYYRLSAPGRVVLQKEKVGEEGKEDRCRSGGQIQPGHPYHP